MTTCNPEKLVELPEQFEDAGTAFDELPGQFEHSPDQLNAPQFASFEWSDRVAHSA